MKVSINRLKEFIPFEQATKEIADLLTASGLEIEAIHKFESLPGSLEGVVIGEVLACFPHPDADRLSLAEVDLGEETVSIVCGAPNVAQGQKVAVATVGSTIYPTDGPPLTIRKAKIRGQVSYGMICAEDELGLGKSHDGIMVLDTSLPNGTPASQFFDLVKDEVLEIGLTPNRADAAPHLGVARDIRALTNGKITLGDVEDFKVDNTHKTIQVE